MRVKASEDPTLTDFNFNNMHMPPAHLEDGIGETLVFCGGGEIETLTRTSAVFTAIFYLVFP